MVADANPQKKKTFKNFFPGASDEAIDLLKKIFVFNEKLRIDAKTALNDKYVKEFSCPNEEEPMSVKVDLPMKDPREFKDRNYREKLYEMI